MSPAVTASWLRRMPVAEELDGRAAGAFGLTAPFWVAAVAVAVVAMLAWRLFTPGRLTTEAESSVNRVASGSPGLHQSEKPKSR